MASKAFLVAVAMVLAVVAPGMAKDIMVGDEHGWKLDFDYIAWAKTKEFHVGDRLVFNYTPGNHTVLRANQTEFQQCLKSLRTPPLTSGSDIINLNSTGTKWYICGVGNHCDARKMKLAINVLPEVGAPAPAPGGNPGSAAIGIAPSKFFSWMVAGLAIFMVIKV